MNESKIIFFKLTETQTKHYNNIESELVFYSEEPFRKHPRQMWKFLIRCLFRCASNRDALLGDRIRKFASPHSNVDAFCEHLSRGTLWDLDPDINFMIHPERLKLYKPPPLGKKKRLLFFEFNQEELKTYNTIRNDLKAIAGNGFNVRINKSNLLSILIESVWNAYVFSEFTDPSPFEHYKEISGKSILDFWEI